MRSHIHVRCLISLASCSLLAQTAAEPATSRAVVELIQKAAVRALNFTQGDAESLRRARTGFTPESWSELMKQMQGFIDEKGTPAFSSKFAPSGKAVVISKEEGLIHLKIPGTLTQTQGASRTTYSHSEIDVKAGGKPLKIEHLEPIYKARQPRNPN
jgi:hypothetical protein